MCYMYRYDPDLLDNETNPFRRARLSLGLTQTELARQARVERLHVLRAEQGLHSAPPDSLLLALTSPGVERRQLAHAYDRWVSEQRALRRLSRRNPVFDGDYAWADVVAASALVAPSSRPSAHAVSKLLLLQPSLLRRYLTADVDSVLGKAAVETALSECGASGRLV